MSNPNQPRVFFLARTPHDTSAATKFGKRVYLFDREPWPTEENNGEFSKRIEEALDRNGFDPDLDFVALTGGPAALALLTFVLARGWNGYIRFLLFDARGDGYVERRIGDDCRTADSSA